MSWLRRLAIFATIAVTSGAVTIFAVGCSVTQPADSADWSADTDPSVESLDSVRKAELSRRAIKPGDPNRAYALGFDAVWNKTDREGKPLRPKPAEAMPATPCSSVEPAGANHIHKETVRLFVFQSGFGVMRMGPPVTNRRGDRAASEGIDRVELVSLLTALQPSVYVLDEIATPPLARQARRRPLDEFETRGLEAVRKGEELVWTREAPKRMFGAIRATADCLRCHSKAKEGDLLGAFTYYLDVPVDQLDQRK